MSEQKNKKNNYFPLFMGLGLVFGILFDQLAIGLMFRRRSRSGNR